MVREGSIFKLTKYVSLRVIIVDISSNFFAIIVAGFCGYFSSFGTVLILSPAYRALIGSFVFFQLCKHPSIITTPETFKSMKELGTWMATHQYFNI